ncbi:MAG: hypothetical protein ACYC6N_03955 [Pirellulaceae bacterium]
MRFEVASLTAAVSLWATMPLGQLVHVAGTLDDASGIAADSVVLTDPDTATFTFSTSPVANQGVPSTVVT